MDLIHFGQVLMRMDLIVKKRVPIVTISDPVPIERNRLTDGKWKAVGNRYGLKVSQNQKTHYLYDMNLLRNHQNSEPYTHSGKGLYG